MVDFALIFQTVAPVLISLLSNTSAAFKAPVSPNSAMPVAVPAPAADAAIKDLQTVLNVVLALNPPLDVDGWLGPKTDDAIEQAIFKIRSLGFGGTQ